MKRKFFAAFLSLCMVMSLIPMTALAAETALEETGDQTLQEQINVAPDGGTVRLDSATTVESLTVEEDKNLTLDLGGNTLTLSSGVSVTDQAYESGPSVAGIWNKGSLTITNGTLAGTGSACLLINSGTLILSDDVSLTKSGAGNAIDNLGGTVTTSANITLSNQAYTAVVTYGGEITINGGNIQANGQNAAGISVFNRGYNNTSTGAQVTINGGTISAYIYALSTNNVRSGGDNPSHVYINGGDLSSTNATAIYWPSAGSLTVGAVGGTNDSVSISSPAGSAIEVCSGTLTVNCGTLNGSDSSDSLNLSSTWAGQYRTNSGCAGLGDGVTVIARRGSGYDTAALNVSIHGGIFSSSDNYAVRYFDCNRVENAAQISQSVSVAIMGGTFNGSTNGGAVDASIVAENDQRFITGGTFSSDVSTYVPTGYEVVKDETSNVWTVDLKSGDGMEAGGTATGNTSTGTVGGSFANDENKDEGVTTSKENLTINVATGSTVEEGGAPTRNTAVTSTTVTIANQSLTSVKESENISNVTIFTDVGSLTLDKDAWSKITTDAGNNSVVLSLSKESDTAETGASQIYEITATVNGKEIYTEGNADGSVEVDVPYDGNAPTVYYLGPDGAEKIDSSHKDGILSWTVEHFSFYAVCAEEQEASVTTSAGKTTCYDTLEGAIDFAQDGDTVKLLKDVIVKSNGTASSSGAIVIDDAITLDGNGKSINAADGFVNTNIINIVNSGEVTIKDVTINGKGQSRHCINIWSATDTSEPCNVTLENVKTTGGLTGVTAGGSTLTIQGVETNIATGSWGVAVNLDSTNSAKNPASLTVKEGTIGNIYIENNANVNGTTAEISGGNIQDVVLQNVESGVKLTITDGNINDVREVSKGSDGNLTDKNPTDMITITGGTFHEDVSDYLADGLVQNADGSVGKPYVPPANPNYKITIGDMENGTVTANPTAAKAGATVTLTPVPDEGYALSTLTVTDRFGNAVRVTENSDGTYTFTMPNGQVTVTATFVETEEPVAEPFIDVAEGDWFYDAVVYAYQNELMDGVGGNRFAPNSETTRAQLVTILYRLEGQPAVSGDLPFTDVETGIWYTDAILWAAQNNIVNGVNDTEFAPGDEITRQQLVTILYRYAEAKGYDVSASADLSGYPDAGQVQDYAQPAMAWAVAENIIQGMEDGTLKPAGNASRAQIATILMRFCEDVAQ